MATCWPCGGRDRPSGWAGPVRPDRGTAEGDEHGQPGSYRRHQHGGPVTGNAGDGPVLVDGHGYGRKQRRADRGAHLAAGVDHAAYQALIAVGDPAASDHHGPERGASGSESNRHDGGQQQAVAAGRGQLGQDQEASGGQRAGQDEDPPDADPASQPGSQHSRGESDDPLRGDGQAGGQR